MQPTNAINYQRLTNLLLMTAISPILETKFFRKKGHFSTGLLMLQFAKLTDLLTDWMDDAGQCWLTLLLSTVFFEKEQLVRDSFEIKGLGYVEWLEARLPVYK